MNIEPRTKVKKLLPYTCARDLYKTGIFFDANENYEQWVKINWVKITELNRYPDSTCDQLRIKLTKKYIKGFDKSNIFVASGSDEIIDLLIRGYVEDNQSIMVMDPSYSIYKTQAKINNRNVKIIRLKPDFALDVEEIKKNIDKVKLLFLCSPNNPTGNLVNVNEILLLLSFYQGLIVIDEAYIEFAGVQNSVVYLIKSNPNIVILRTFSKAWGLAGIRIGYAIAHSSVINILLKIKESYNVSKTSQLIALQALDQTKILSERVKKILLLKTKLERQLEKLRINIISTKTNFILARLKNASLLFKQLAEKNIIVRDRSNLPYLNNVLRITVGSQKENKLLLDHLKKLI